MALIPRTEKPAEQKAIPMIIACLGWGSLIWDPRTLLVRNEWFTDGPFASIEFTRQSSDGHITLVIDRSAVPVRLLWAQMATSDLAIARESLRDREQITAKEWSSLIGSWKRGDLAPDTIPALSAWAESRGVEAVIWTALEPKFKGRDQGQSPSAQEVIAHLNGLTGPQRDYAKQYIERAPRQIDTEYRRRIEATLGWSYKNVLR
jgi:cation transport regulator ChaC